MTSARSASPSSSWSSCTGAGRKPPSLPICQNGSAARAGRRASGLVTIFRSRKRELQPLRKPKPIPARLDLQLRPGAAVDHHGVAEELRVPDRRDVAGRDVGAGEVVEERAAGRVEQRAVAVEASGPGRPRGARSSGCRAGRPAAGPARQHPRGQIRGAAAEQVEAGRPGVDVDPGHAQRVVVVPHGGGALVVLVLEHRRARRPPRCQRAWNWPGTPRRSVPDPGIAGGDVGGVGQVPGLGVAVALLGAVGRRAGGSRSAPARGRDRASW